MAKSIVFLGSSEKTIRSFSLDVQKYFALNFRMLERGLEPLDWKPMKSIGLGVREIRVKDKDGIYRVIYVIKVKDKIHILHAFQKKSQKTAKHDLDLAKARMKLIIIEGN
jgi:phage-related protein